MTYKVQTGAHR